MLIETDVQSLGPPKINAPPSIGQFIEDDERVIFELSVDRVCDEVRDGGRPVSFLKAGPRRTIFFDPSKLKCALVTCGGLCPGLNNVIRSVFQTLWYTYGVRNVLGIRYGLQGFIPEYGHDVVEMTPDAVGHINEIGGTVLGSSRGPQSMEEIVDALERMNIGILFMIGGDGTFRAAAKMVEEIGNRGSRIGVVGIPKTIDNDIHLMSRSFGFNTAVSMARYAIASAHAEATGAPNGVGLVKLMGRHSGFVAATAVLAKLEANLVLIPEADFDIEGPDGLLSWLEKRLKYRKHAVIVVAEGAGQDYCGSEAVDESGNRRLGDIGIYLKERIQEHFSVTGIELNLKYIDPSYMIRSVPADSEDSIFCGFLAQNAVHAGMRGYTGMVVGLWNDEYVYLPMSAVIARRKRIDLKGRLWRSVLEATGQPELKNDSLGAAVGGE